MCSTVGWKTGVVSLICVNGGSAGSERGDGSVSYLVMPLMCLLMSFAVVKGSSF